MESIELYCSICQQYFNDQENIPRMLPACGHTFCSKCIQNIIDKLPMNQNFTCPEDKVPWLIEKRDVTIFPKNYILLRLIEKKKNLYNSPESKLSTEDHYNSRNISFIKEKQLMVKSPSSRLDLSYLSSFNQILNKSINEYSSNFDLLTMCNEHYRKLEIVCMDHKCRICSKCALFGNHKNHDIKSEEEILNEISTRAKCILNLLEIIDQNQLKMFDQSYVDKLNSKMKSKYEELVQIVHEKFQEYTQLLKSRERKLLDDINEKFSILEHKIIEFRQLPKDMTEKIQKWKLSAQDKLTVLNEKMQKNEIAFELLEDKYNLKGDIIIIGQKIIDEFNRIAEIPILSLDDTLNSTSIIFNDNFNDLVEKLCALVSNISIDLNFNWNNTKQSYQSPRRRSVNVNNSSPKLPYALNHSLSWTFDDKNIMATEKKTEEDLLNFGLNTFDLVEIPEIPVYSDLKNKEYQTMPKNNISTPTSLLSYKEKSQKNPDSFTLGYESRNLEKNAGIDGKSILSRSMSPNIAIDSIKKDLGNTVKKSDNLDSSQDEKSGLLVTPKKLIPMTDSIKAANANNKKKLNFKVPEKFEVTIESMKNGNIENVDLTGAELGDTGMQHISDLISKGKGIKSLKLVKNKISDEGLQALVKSLGGNTSIHTINLTQNTLSDRSLDILISLLQINKTIKKIYLNQNLVNIRNSKNKIKEINNLGVEIYL